MSGWGMEFYVQHRVSLKYEKCEILITTIRGKPEQCFDRLNRDYPEKKDAPLHLPMQICPPKFVHPKPKTN